MIWCFLASSSCGFNVTLMRDHINDVRRCRCRLWCLILCSVPTAWIQNKTEGCILVQQNKANHFNVHSLKKNNLYHTREGHILGQGSSQGIRPWPLLVLPEEALWKKYLWLNATDMFAFSVLKINRTMKSCQLYFLPASALNSQISKLLSEMKRTGKRTYFLVDIKLLVLSGQSKK